MENNDSLIILNKIAKCVNGVETKRANLVICTTQKDVNRKPAYAITNLEICVIKKAATSGMQ